MWWKNKSPNLVNPQPLPDRWQWKRRAVVFLVIVSGSVILLAGASAAYLRIYQERVYPGVSVGQYDLGGLSAEQVRNFIEGLNNRLIKEGISITAKSGERELKFQINAVLASDNSTELFHLDSGSLIEQALSVGRQGVWWRKLLAPWQYRLVSPVALSAPVVLDKFNLVEILKSNLAPLASPVHNANLEITDLSGLNYRLVSEQAGEDFLYDSIAAQIGKNLSVLSLSPIAVSPQPFAPTIVTADVIKIAPRLSDVFNYGSLRLNYIDSQTQLRRDWEIAARDYAGWIEVVRDEAGELVFSLRPEAVGRFLESLRYLVERPVQDAKFVVSDGKVKEFQASQPGQRLDSEATAKAVLFAFQERNFHPNEITKTVGLVMEIVEPKIKMAEVNDLGIEGVLGAGISTFRDSHTNRIKNIATAVKRLNGILIKPGEEFSAIASAGPFTAENGFLPEDVIKGKEIKKEIGGGMCQIGTTLFRMAMNSGMPITERNNHSLVVRYYADPVNGNPGTDATLYEPTLDFKFLNDTGSYLLLQAEIDYEKQQLVFTLWGKPDGRKGWYSHPTVSKWIPAGEPQIIKTDKLKVGVEKCQSAFNGAVASFTYTRITPQGEKIDRVFNSYYRPLPKTCMVGVDPAELKCQEEGNCTASVAAGSPTPTVTTSTALETE